MKFLIGLATLLMVVSGVALLLVLSWFVLGAIAVVFLFWLALSRRGRQIVSVAEVGVSTLPQRVGASLVVVVGIAGVVAVLVTMLAMAEGYQQTLRSTGNSDTAIVLRGGSAAESMSTLDHNSVLIIEQAPGVATDTQGSPIVSPELVVGANVAVKDAVGPNDKGSVQLRGVGEQSWNVRPNAKIIDGRKFESGKYELVVGRGAQKQFNGLNVGSELRLGSQVWRIVGAFETGDAQESEMWADVGILGSAYRRGSTVTSVFVRLADARSFQIFSGALQSDPRLRVDSSTTLDYFSKQSEGISRLLRLIGVVVGMIMAIGALVGALNTMFAAVATRTREIATLRAIGFGGTPVVVAILLETMLLALIGGILGGLAAWLLFNGYTASTIAAGGGKLTFELKVTPQLLWTGVKWGLAIGFVGGLYPALHAGRLPVNRALQEFS